MALLADDAADRADQLLALTRRLAELVAAESADLAAGRVPESGDELRRLANAYRLEMARIRDDRTLIAGAPLAMRQALQTETVALQTRLDRHLVALSAVREVTEGLVRAVAEEVQRARGPATYGAQGARTEGAPTPVALDQRA